MPQTTSDSGPLSTVAVDVLLALSHGPQHGYGIKLDIERRVGGAFVLGSGSLYQAIQRLARRGFIAEDETSSPVEDARRGRVYRIEPAGVAALQAELRRMNRVLRDASAHDLAPEGTV